MTIELASTEEITKLWASIVSGRTSYATYAALQAAVSRPIGAIAEVQGDDGTHQDPVSILDVPNNGVYRRVTEGWERISDLVETVITGLEEIADSFDEFVAKYLGSAAVAPVTGFGGVPLAAGMLYYDTVANTLMVYTGAAWQDVANASTILLLPNAGTKSIAAGVITVDIDGSMYTVDTAAAAAYDDLDTINNGTDGQVIYLRSADAARRVKVTTAGNIHGGAFWLRPDAYTAFVWSTAGAKWFPLRDDNIVLSYTPTFSNTLNQASAPVHLVANYQQKGNFVEVWGACTVDVGTSADSQIQITLPIDPQSNFAAVYDAVGYCATSEVQPGGYGVIVAVSAAKRVLLRWIPDSTAAVELVYHFTYSLK